MSQILRPISTIASDGGWTVTGAVLPNDAVDESSADGDTSYITGAAAASLTLGLDAPANPPASLDVIVTIRNRGVGALTGSERITASLYSGSTLLGTGTITPLAITYTDQAVTISPSAVGDWNDLRLKIDAVLCGNIRVTQVFATVADGATALSARTGRAARMLVNTATVSRKTEGQAATGHGYGTYADVYSLVPVNIQTRDGEEERQYGRETGLRMGVAYMSPGTDIRNTDRLTTIAGGGIVGFSGCTLEVISPPQDHGGRGAYTMVKWREVKGGPTT